MKHKIIPSFRLEWIKDKLFIILYIDNYRSIYN